MKIAYSTLACPRWSIEEAVVAAVQYGYDAIEWRLADGEIITPATSQTVRQRLRELPRAHGIAIACLDSSCRVVQATEQERIEVVEEASRMLDLAAEIGSTFLRVFGGPLPAAISRAELIDPTAAVLHRIGMYAAERGITVVLETHDDWSQSADLLTLLKAANAPAVKVLWDIHHTYRSGEAPVQSVADLGSSIAFVHVKDGRPSPARADGWQLCLLNEGVVPLREAYDALKQSGYDGYLSLEWEKKWHPEIEEPEIALPQASPFLRSVVGG